MRHWSGALGFTAPPVVFGTAATRALLREAAAAVGLDLEQRPLGLLAADVERYRLRSATESAKSGSQPPHRAQGAGRPGALPALAAAYETQLLRRNGVDYPAMLTLPLRAFERHQPALQLCRDAYRAILADEFQDLCSAQYTLLRLLGQEHRNVAVVGDPRQCVPVDTLVQTPEGEMAIQTLRPADTVVAAAGRGRVIEARVTGVFSRPFDGELVRVTMGSGRVLRLTPDHMCFARLGVRPDLYFVYLMYRSDLGYRVGIAVGARRGEVAGGYEPGLSSRTRQERAEKAWVLSVCSSRAEASFYEQFWSVQYGVPTALFHPDAGRNWDERSIRRLYASIDTRANAARLMSDVGLHESYPHHRPQGLTIGGEGRRVLVHLSMFGGNEGSLRSPWSMHRLWLNSTDAVTRQLLEQHGPRTRSGAKGTWRVERHFRNLSEAVARSDELARAAGGLEVVRTAMLTDGPRFMFQPASHLRPSMILPVVRDGRVVEEEIAAVDREPYRGLVYDLDVEHVHNYAASGIVVHNCLYAWRGANIRVFRDFLADFPEAQVHVLEQNFRATGYLVALANALGTALGYPRGLWTDNPAGQEALLYGAADEHDEATFVAAEIARLSAGGQVDHLGEVAVLYRTNGQARTLVGALQARGLAYELVGGETDADALAADAADTADAADQPPISTAGDAVVLTTIHAAKGAEWRVVFVVGLEDGLLPHAHALVESPDGSPPAGSGSAAAPARTTALDEELRVAYVAVTRPRERLYLTYCRTRQRGEWRQPRCPSRFLQALPAALIRGVEPVGAAGGAGRVG